MYNMKRKITLADVQRARRMQLKNINKLNLEESINRAIKKAVYESFSSWKETNVPKFDEKIFREKMNLFLEPLYALQNSDDINIIQLFAVQDNGKCVLLHSIDKSSESNPTQFISYCLRVAETTFKDNDDRVNALNKCFIAIKPASKNFMSYLVSMKDPANPDYIHVNNDLSIRIHKDKVLITWQQILDHFDDLVDFFS